VTGVANRFGDHFGRHRRGEKNDVGARCHHVAKFELAQLVDPFVDGDGLGRFRSCLFSSDDAFSKPRQSDEGAVGRSLNVVLPTRTVEGAAIRLRTLRRAAVLAPRFAAVGIERLDEETLGAAAASQEDVGRRSSNINTATGSAAP